MKTFPQLLEEVGFTPVAARDKTDLFTEVLQRELTRIQTTKESFIQVDRSL